MGVSAVGKSTVGAALAAALDVPFVDADDLHSAANHAKMAAGIPLDDADRWPWLDAVGARLRAGEDTGLVIACSALRRVYRDRIRAAEPGVVFVHLAGSPQLLAERARERKGHFMPAALLQSQLATLEPLEDDEAGLVVDVAAPVDKLVAAAAEALGQPLR